MVLKSTSIFLIQPKFCFMKIRSPLVSEPPCLAEIERIQVLDGGKRKFGRCPTSHKALLAQGLGSAFSSVEGFYSADDKQEVGIKSLITLVVYNLILTDG